MKKKHQVALALSIIIIVAAAVAYEAISAKPITWQTVDTLSSSGTQDIAPFPIDNVWRVAWKISQEDPAFVLAVYMKNDAGGYSDEVAQTSYMDTNSTQGILPVVHTGTFVMRVVVSSNDTQWVLYIQEPNPA